MFYGKKIYLFCFLVLSTGPSFAQTGGSPGIFTRSGFGARGMGMGNALTAVPSGEISGFYNPSLLPFTTSRMASISYGYLSLDRHLNSIYFTQPIDSNAAVSVGILNSGVSAIDGRDIDGFHTENYSTSENLFLLSFGLKIKKIVIGVTPKLYYNSLFKDFSSTAFGFDAGLTIPIGNHLTAAAVFKDANAKYRWDSSVLYDELGNSTTEKFDLRKIIAVSYSADDLGLLSAEFESNTKASIIRAGAEVELSNYFTFRAGIDGWNTKNAEHAHPSFGFTVYTGYTQLTPALNYAYVLEPYGLFAIHVVSISVIL